MSGKPANFPAEQVQALRRALRDFYARNQSTDNPWSQKRLGAEIGVSQQVAGKLLGKEPAGLSLPTAKRIASLEGFLSLDEFFAAHDPAPVDPTADRGNRALAVAVARRMGLSDAAVDAVLSRYAASQFDGRPTKWWVEKLIAEDNSLDDLRAAQPAAEAQEHSGSRPVEHVPETKKTA